MKHHEKAPALSGPFVVVARTVCSGPVCVCHAVGVGRHGAVVPRGATIPQRVVDVQARTVPAGRSVCRRPPSALGPLHGVCWIRKRRPNLDKANDGRGQQTEIPASCCCKFPSHTSFSVQCAPDDESVSPRLPRPSSNSPVVVSSRGAARRIQVSAEVDSPGACCPCFLFLPPDSDSEVRRQGPSGWMVIIPPVVSACCCCSSSFLSSSNRLPPPIPPPRRPRAPRHR